MVMSPRFDSSAALCQILDVGNGGYLAIYPRHRVISRSRAYHTQSNVLVMPGVTFRSDLPDIDGHGGGVI